MLIQTKKLPKSQIELIIEVPPQELKPFLEKAAQKISREAKFSGFRVGHAPYEIVKQQMGEMAIYEEALEPAVQKTFAQAVFQENIETVGQPKIEVQKLAPDNPLVYKATVALLPKVKLGDYKKIKVTRKKIEIPQTQVEKVLQDLQKMQSQEVLVDRGARDQDKVVVDMDMSLDNIPLESGQTKNHTIYLNESYYVPGLKEKLLGARKEETLKFQLLFPKTHYQKNLAGREVNFQVKIKEIFEIIPPELNDNFAKSLGQESLRDLKALLRKNLEAEAHFKEEQRLEIEILDQLVAYSKFEELPDLLVDTECHKMLHELEESFTQNGLEFKEYLKNIKKTKDELLLNFAPQATKRVKTALVTRLLAQGEKIEVTESEIDQEIERTSKVYKDKFEMQEKIRSDEARQYLKNVLKNKKVIQLLKNRVVKQ